MHYFVVVISAGPVQSAGMRRPTLTSDSSSVRNIPVNSDLYLVKTEDSIPADEKFFYRSVVMGCLSFTCRQEKTRFIFMDVPDIQLYLVPAGYPALFTVWFPFRFLTVKNRIKKPDNFTSFSD